MDPDPGIMSPIIQYGFAGFAAVLFASFLWLVKIVLASQERSNKVISNNTEALNNLSGKSKEAQEESRRVNDLLLSRPCLLPRESRGKG